MGPVIAIIFLLMVAPLASAAAGDGSYTAGNAGSVVEDLTFNPLVTASPATVVGGADLSGESPGQVATLTGSGSQVGYQGSSVNGLTLNPSVDLSNVDLYLGSGHPDEGKIKFEVIGTPIKTGIANLSASVNT